MILIWYKWSLCVLLILVLLQFPALSDFFSKKKKSFHFTRRIIPRKTLEAKNKNLVKGEEGAEWRKKGQREARERQLVKHSLMFFGRKTGFCAAATWSHSLSGQLDWHNWHQAIRCVDKKETTFLADLWLPAMATCPAGLVVVAAPCACHREGTSSRTRGGSDWTNLGTRQGRYFSQRHLARLFTSGFNAGVLSVI